MDDRIWRFGCTQAELFAQPPEGFLFGGGERAHFVGDDGGLVGEDLCDEGFTGGGEGEGDFAPVFGVSDALNQPLFLEVVEDKGDVAGGLEQLGADLPRAQRAEMVKGFEDAELAEGQVTDLPAVQEAAFKSAGCAGELDECVQGQFGSFVAFKMCWHQISPVQIFRC